MFLLNDLKKFQTKKRSSDSAVWVAWACISAAAIVVMSALALIQLGAMSRGEIRFVNFRLPVLEDFRANKEDISRDGVLDEKTLMVFVGEKYVLVGTAQGVMAPKPEADVVLLPKENWENNAVEKVLAWKHAQTVFPAKVVALATQDAVQLGTFFEVQEKVVTLVREVNRKITKLEKGAAPAVVLVSARPRLMATAPEHTQ